MNIYQAISAIASDLAAEGVSKDRKVEFGRTKYNFRGIDDAYGALAPLLVKHKVVILPRYVSHKETTWETKDGQTMFKALVEAEYDFVLVEPDQPIGAGKHTIRTIGEGMDSGDKAVNKAMSNAYKYAVWQTFCVPIEGVAADAETDGHSVRKTRENGDTNAFAVAKRLGLGWPEVQGHIREVCGVTVPKPEDAGKLLSKENKERLLAKFKAIEVRETREW